MRAISLLSAGFFVRSELSTARGTQEMKFHKPALNRAPKMKQKLKTARPNPNPRKGIALSRISRFIHSPSIINPNLNPNL
jgi:hypothetical protein